VATSVSVNCNNCGASLTVDERTRFVTCMHCGSKLEIKRDHSVAFTDVIERIDQNTSSAARDLEIIRLEQQLERLDREWAQRQPDGKSPTTQAASGIVGAIVAAFVIMFGVFFAKSSHAAGAPIIFPIAGVVFVLVAVVGVVNGLIFAGTLSGEKKHEQRRSALIARIISAQGKGAA
jgi:DNA-directed RNA polymerase subunit RPC12/RpoP